MDEKMVDEKIWADGLGEDEAICDRCRGFGLVFLTKDEDPHFLEGEGRSYSKCPKCGGNGKVDWARAAMNFGPFYNPFKEDDNG